MPYVPLQTENVDGLLHTLVGLGRSPVSILRHLIGYNSVFLVKIRKCRGSFLGFLTRGGRDVTKIGSEVEASRRGRLFAQGQDPRATLGRATFRAPDLYWKQDETKIPNPVHTEVDPPSTALGRDDLRVVLSVSARFHVHPRFPSRGQELCG